MSWDAETDVLVIGAGACGFAAAITAHDAGAEAAIVEKLDRVGGNSSLSTGSVPGAGSRFQREAGIVDSPERMIDDLLRQSGPHDCPELTRLLAESSAALVEWLVDRVGARMSLITDYCHVGHTVPRLHAPRSRRGQDLVDDLVAAADSRCIPVAVGNPARRLLADDTGAVIGAELEAGGRVSRMRAGKVILATNGFAANRKLVAEFCPEIAAAEYFGALGSTGEAVEWGRALGADLANIGAYQGYAAVAYPQGSLLSWTTIEKGGILVRKDGQRFGDEGAGYSGYAKDVMAQGDLVYAVFDERIRRVAALEEEFEELCRHGGVKHAESAEALAALFGVDPAALAGTIEAYGAAASGRAPDPFARRSFGLAPLEPPYFIARVKPGLFHTQGGLRVDGSARVLRPDGAPIANLFAGGGAAAGISGRTGGGGYSSGNGLLAALGLGRIAGLAAVAELRG
jgi:fumarate reductase flavoprotein subunit